MYCSKTITIPDFSSFPFNQVLRGSFTTAASTFSTSTIYTRSKNSGSGLKAGSSLFRGNTVTRAPLHFTSFPTNQIQDVVASKPPVKAPIKLNNISRYMSGCFRRFPLNSRRSKLKKLSKLKGFSLITH